MSVELPVETGTSLFTAAMETRAEPDAVAGDVLDPAPAGPIGRAGDGTGAEDADVPALARRVLGDARD